MFATDENCSEMHRFFPDGKSSWCNLKKSISLFQQVPSHPRALSLECRDRFLTILEPYIRIDFLCKLKAGRTSNFNESLHNLIYNIISKLMHFEASLAVIRYNNMFAMIIELVQELGLEPFQTFTIQCCLLDSHREMLKILKVEKVITRRRWSMKQSQRKRKG